MTAAPKALFDSLSAMMEFGIQPLMAEAHHQADYTISAQFLKSYMGSQGTYNSYRREVERLLHWCWLIKKSNLKDLKREDIEAFIRFCQSPPASWISTQKVAKFISKSGQRVPNPDWRPFVAGISKAARKQGHRPSIQQFQLSEGAVAEIFAILSTYFNFLITEQYIQVNPVALIRQKSKFIRRQQQRAPIRRLSLVQWEKILESVEILAAEDPARHERSRFILTALYGMYLRISELAASDRWVPCMNHFTKDSSGSWWFTTVGKGNKLRQIAVSDAMMASLVRWRKFLGLSAYPSVADTSPLLPKIKGHGPIRDTTWLRRMVQACFDHAQYQLEAQGLEEEADALAKATVHWLRHTGISEDVKHRPREHVRDDAGHSSSATTDRYIDVEMTERHRSARDKVI